MERRLLNKPKRLRERIQVKMKESRSKSKFSPSLDVVLIKDDLPRGKWRTGKLHELIISRDGKVRSAKVLLPPQKWIGRPLNLLFPIDAQQKDTNQQIKILQMIQQQIRDNMMSMSITRPRREAATKALHRIKKQLSDY